MTRTTDHSFEDAENFKEEFEVADSPSDPEVRRLYEDEMNRLRLLSLAKATRKAQRLSQKQVAEAMGTTQSAVSDLEYGRTDPRVSTWQRYARALGKHFSFSLTDVHSPTPSVPSAMRQSLNIAELTLSPVLTELSAVTSPQDAKRISRETRLPEALVTRVLARLAEAGWAEVTERGKDRSFRLKNDAANAIGLSLHRDRIRGVLVDMDGQVVDRAMSSLTKSTPDVVIETAVTTIGRLFGSSQAKGKKVLGVGVALAGVVDAVSGAVKYAPDLASDEDGWAGVLLESAIQERIQDTVQVSLRVAVENDAKALALWRLHRRLPSEAFPHNPHRPGATSAVLLMTGGGIGAGITVDGQLIRGKNSAAGELGHLIVDHSDNAPACRTGRKHSGCLETVATVQGILRRIGLPADSGTERIAGLRQAEALLEQGNTVARDAFYCAGRFVGRVLPLLSVLDPDNIVVYASPYLHDPKYRTSRLFQEGVADALTEADVSGVLVESEINISWEQVDDETGAIAAAVAMLHSHFLNRPEEWYPRLRTTVERDSALVLT